MVKERLKCLEKVNMLDWIFMKKKKYAYSESDLVLQDDGKRNLDES